MCGRITWLDPWMERCCNIHWDILPHLPVDCVRWLSWWRVRVGSSYSPWHSTSKWEERIVWMGNESIWRWNFSWRCVGKTREWQRCLRTYLVVYKLNVENQFILQINDYYYYLPMMSSPPSAVGTMAAELFVRTSVYPEVTFDFFLFDMESNTPVHVHSISVF